MFRNLNLQNFIVNFQDQMRRNAYEEMDISLEILESEEFKSSRVITDKYVKTNSLSKQKEPLFPIDQKEEKTGDNLIIVAVRQKHDAVILKLLELSAWVHITNKEGMTPFHVAFENNDTYIFGLLLTAPTLDKSFNFIKMLAAIIHDAENESYDFLLKKAVGAFPLIENEKASMVLKMIAYHKKSEILDHDFILENLSEADNVQAKIWLHIIFEISEHKFKYPSKWQEFLNQLLESRIKRRDEASMETLIRHGANRICGNHLMNYIGYNEGFKRWFNIINISNNMIINNLEAKNHSEGDTLLIMAAFENCLDAVLKILEWGAKTDTSNYKEETALHCALDHKNFKMLHALLSYNALFPFYITILHFIEKNLLTSTEISATYALISSLHEVHLRQLVKSGSRVANLFFKEKEIYDAFEKPLIEMRSKENLFLGKDTIKIVHSYLFFQSKPLQEAQVQQDLPNDWRRLTKGATL